MSSDLSELSMKQAHEILRTHGLRRTFARACVLRSIVQFSAPVTHAEMSERLVDQGPDHSTIFRALKDLVDADILVRLDIGDHHWRFELRQQSSSRLHSNSQHPHVVCRECCRIECVEWQKELAIPMTQLLGWQIDEAIFRGFCDDCRRS